MKDCPQNLTVALENRSPVPFCFLPTVHFLDNLSALGITVSSDTPAAERGLFTNNFCTSVDHNQHLV